MVNEVFNVSAEFDTCRQVIVESGVTRPYLDLILGKSVPNPHTPIFGDPKYAWLTPLSTYGRCFGKCLSADCKDVAVERDLPCALVARAFPFAVPNKKGTPTPIIRMLALVWHAYAAVESWREDRTVMLRFPSSEPPGWGKCTSTGRLKGVKVTAQPRRMKERSKPGEYNNCKAQHRRSGRRCSRQQSQQECSMATWEGTFLNGRYRIYLVAERF